MNEPHILTPLFELAKMSHCRDIDEFTLWSTAALITMMIVRAEPEWSMAFLAKALADPDCPALPEEFAEFAHELAERYPIR